jgi:hypothetical protein
MRSPLEDSEAGHGGSGVFVAEGVDGEGLEDVTTRDE